MNKEAESTEYSGQNQINEGHVSGQSINKRIKVLNIQGNKHAVRVQITST